MGAGVPSADLQSVSLVDLAGARDGGGGGGGPLRFAGVSVMTAATAAADGGGIGPFRFISATFSAALFVALSSARKRP